MPATPLTSVAGPAARAEARGLAAAALLGVAGVGLELARPWPLALAVDAAVGDNRLAGLAPTTLLVLAGAALVAISALAGLIDMAAGVSAERAAEHIGARLRQDTFDAALSLSLRWHDRMRSGELVSRLTSDVGRVLDAVVALAATLVPDAARLLLVLLVLVTIDPALALIALAVVPVLALFAVRQRRRVRAAQHVARAESGRFTAAAADLVRNVRAVQSFDRAGRALGIFAAHNTAVRTSAVHAATVESRWTPVADVVLAVGSGLVLVVGGRRVLDGTLRPGDLLVVASYVGALYSPVRGLSRLSGVLAKSGASAARIAEVLHGADRLPVAANARPAPPVRDGVRLVGVGFGYQPGRPVLRDLDLELPAGTVTCLFGRSGAGKSTVLNLLLRLHDVDSGAVLIDGVDVRDLDPHSLRARIAFVPQDPWLLDATIAGNIAFGTPRVARHAVLAAGRAALVDEFAHALPDGYDTPVGEAGARLSGGQRRRVALARAALSNAPVLLLDEPTAALDRESAAAVIESIRRTVAGRTVLIVTHDRDLAALADRVIVLEPARAAAPAAAPVLLTGGR